MCVLPDRHTSKDNINPSVPRQFHFANIHRADVHSVLVAAGFGTPSLPVHPTFFPPEPSVPHETVPVKVGYQEHQNGAAGLLSRGGARSDSTLDRDQGYAQEPIISGSTPFFHVDLVAAVRAAEKLGLKEEGQSENGESGPSESSPGDILIDLHN